ncbi:MAG: lipoyl synthase [bacterium]|nr:lipoyl synthase [bacterium]
MTTKKTTDKRLPPWLRREVGKSEHLASIKRILRSGGLHTVCEEAKCPNLAECFEKKRATFLIMGDSCTRGCGFCSVTGGVPTPLDLDEPEKVAKAAEAMGAKYVVITSVTRDDLPDGGASHYATTIGSIKKLIAGSSIEVLTPDFGGDMDAVDLVCKAGPDVYNHNMETVASLYNKVRPEAIYERSLELLGHVKKRYSAISTKSGIMLGLGETMPEVSALLEDLKSVGCDIVTIGQYMKPTRNSLDVASYLEPKVFKQLEKEAQEMGFKGVYSGPLVRSSFNAEELKSSTIN